MTPNKPIRARPRPMPAQVPKEIRRNLGFTYLRHKEIVGRNLTEVDLDTAVDGDYANIVRFMNNLQRSHNFYIVESLNLQAQGQGTGPGTMRIGLKMKTYFRTTA